MAFRFRDVRNQLERLSDDTVIVHQRLGDLLTTAASSLSVKKGWM
jgi:hypothetical protein